MASWGFPDQRRRVRLCIVHNLLMGLRDIAPRLDITERSAHGIITTDLARRGCPGRQVAAR